MGVAQDIAVKDIKGLENSAVVFAVLDGLDSGTLFEIGYARAKGIPVITLVQNESPDALKMVEGTHCTLERDLVTAIYKTVWAALAAR
jgi:nucleoside 2-deoxyribosyltransferase